jgi:two-component system, NarL family, response regulator LiaR
MSNEEIVRLLICDDQTIVCEGLRAILSTIPKLKVVGIAHNGIEAINQIPTTHPDLILMD